MDDDISLAFLGGTIRDTCGLSVFRGHKDILHMILSILWQWYDSHIDTGVAYTTMRTYIEFPEPQGLNINMMPIKIYDLKSTLPSNCYGYRNAILACNNTSLSMKASSLLAKLSVDLDFTSRDQGRYRMMQESLDVQIHSYKIANTINWHGDKGGFARIMASPSMGSTWLQISLVRVASMMLSSCIQKR
jgi:hypothetical protein